ncbi:MAG TPA: hypothetical protein VE399_11305 [Gemmatimonadales bacterium]|jgi:hypothetical protein|nr:hypothetical protein [Gemmatimonadales bacterium]
MPFIRTELSPGWCLGVLALVACSAHAQEQPKPLPAVQALSTGQLAGQTIAVLPITLVVADPSLESDTVYQPYRERRAALLRADSLVGAGLQARGPEVNWVLPPELRKIARRSAGFVDDPDQMGQAVLRSPNLTKVPDPLRSSLRELVAVVDGRIAMVPASLGFGPEANGQIRADLTLVLADCRSGKILWRSLAYGRGATPDQALNAAVAAVLPVSPGP